MIILTVVCLYFACGLGMSMFAETVIDNKYAIWGCLIFWPIYISVAICVILTDKFINMKNTLLGK